MEISAYGGHTNVVSPDETIDTYYQRDQNDTPAIIAYQQKKENLYMLSYKVQGMIIYKQFFFGYRMFHTYSIRYPANKQAEYGPMVNRISETFVLGPEWR